ncbi:hypothetical protein VT06_11590 [Arsukibacterium sp. MJ3]|uniref:CLCA_X family protein n=1 Tax=Arsukibacterium sp. MJ3 TaxID=1632859 RepID=UPI0006273D39|nr:CLCA_X family protein [Arsukibacterium sp. MJ3]KKO48516.1 hypothetical protein VT06_11590 [Arsukibacterium sp. MJ3]
MADNHLLRQYYRNGPPHRGGADVSFGDLVKIFGFNSIHIGRWVKPAEQQQAANLFFDALCDLQLLLQVPEQVISLNGRLALTYGIGGRPGVSAHYQPQGRILALAKNAGGGSLAHEWFHAFDHYIASKLFTDSPPANRFASRCWLENMPLRQHPLNALLDQAFSILFLSVDGNSESAFFQHCRLLDQQRQQLYWAMPEEIAARAFEKTLQRQHLKNSFLVAGTLKSAAAKQGIYPDEFITHKLSQLWLSYFQGLGQSLKQQH